MLQIYLKGISRSHSKWSDMITKVQDLVIDTLNTLRNDQGLDHILDINYDVYLNHEQTITMMEFKDVDYTSYNLHIPNLFTEFQIIDNPNCQMFQDQDKPNFDIVETSYISSLVELFTENCDADIIIPTDELQQHLIMFSHDRDLYYSCKSEVTGTMLDDIMTIFENHSNNPAENKISNFIIYYLLPLIVYDTQTENIYTYDVSGWILTSKNKLYTIISKDLDILFTGMQELISYYGSINNRTRLITDICNKIPHICSIESMDNKHLVGMKNGVYNSQDGCFYDFSPEFYVSKSTQIMYQPNSPLQHKLVSILLKIFPDNQVLYTVMRWFGYLLEFGNPEKFLTIWHGASGNNGKSWVQRLIKETFGEYYYNIPTSLITSKRASSNSATPDLASLEHKLVVFFQEPDNVEKIHSGRVKELTGNDSIYVRPLYGKPKNIDIWAKMVIVANNKMETIGLDSALRRRFLVIPFESTFVTESEFLIRKKNNLSLKNYYIREDIDYLTKELAPVFMELIIEQHNLYKREGITVSDKILQVTNDFILSNNRVLKFIKAHIIYTVGESSSLQMVYEQFKGWYRQLYPAKQLLSMEMFQEELSRESITIIDDAYIKDVSCNYTSAFSR